SEQKIDAEASEEASAREKSKEVKQPKDTRDYYQILGVSHGCSPDEIRKAYKKRARETHSDKNLENKKKAEEEFKKVLEAYEILFDIEKRAEYDCQGTGFGGVFVSEVKSPFAFTAEEKEFYEQLVACDWYESVRKAMQEWFYRFDEVDFTKNLFKLINHKKI